MRYLFLPHSVPLNLPVFLCVCLHLSRFVSHPFICHSSDLSLCHSSNLCSFPSLYFSLCHSLYIFHSVSPHLLYHYPCHSTNLHIHIIISQLVFHPYFVPSFCLSSGPFREKLS